MTADSSIYGMIRPPAPMQDPVQQYGAMMQLRAMGDQSAMSELQRTRLTQDLAEEQAFKSKIANWANSGATGAVTPDVWAASPTRSAAFEKSRIDAEKAQAELRKTKLETHGKEVQQWRDILAATNDDSHLPELREATTRLYGPAKAAQLPASVSAPGFAEWKKSQIMTADQFVDQSKPKFEKVDVGGKVQMIDVNPVTNPAIKSMSFTKSATPGEVMTDKRQREFYAPPNVGDQETEKQIDYWATVVRNGGSLPPGLARGPGGSAFVREVTKRAATGTVTPEEMMSNQAQFQGEKAGQRTLGSRTANVEMAANEAASLADLAKQASAKVDRTHFKAFNDVIQAGQRATASPELRAFTASNTSLINAYARAINPQGVGTVADKEHAREMLSTGFSKGDYQAAVDQLLKEIDAARKSPAQVKKAMRDQFTGKEAPTGNAEPGKPATGGIKFLGWDK